MKAEKTVGMWAASMERGEGFLWVVMLVDELVAWKVELWAAEKAALLDSLLAALSVDLMGAASVSRMVESWEEPQVV